MRSLRLSLQESDGEGELPNPFSEDHRFRIKAISVSSNERARNILIWDGLKSNGYSKGQSYVKKKQLDDLETSETTISREIISVIIILPFQHSSAPLSRNFKRGGKYSGVHLRGYHRACTRERTSARI